jgi:hypothetical protein
MIGSREYRAGLVSLAIALAASGTVVYLRIWRVPTLNGPRTGAPGLLVTRMGIDSGLFDLRCPSPLEVSEPIETAVCDVVRHRQRLICRRVRLCATVESDCFEHSVLMGDGCEQGLVPFGGADSLVDALFDSVCSLSSRRPAEVTKAATFTGILRPFGHGLNDAMALEIEKVEDIRPAKGTKDKHKTGAR